MSCDISFTNSHITPNPNTTINEIFGASVDGNEPMGVFFSVDEVNGNVVTSERLCSGYSATSIEVGAEVLIHHTLCKSTSPSAAVKANLGKYEIRRITAFTDDYRYYTLDKAPDVDTDNFYVQAAVIQEIQNLSLNVYEDGTHDWLQAHMFNYNDNKLGGILALRIWDTLTLNGGHIDLRNAGIDAMKGYYTDDTELAPYRPILAQESSGTLDTALYSGCENSITKDRLPLNVGCGVLFLIAKNIVVTDSSSRIGNPELSGVQYCRGSADSKAAHSGTNVGGSTIFIACNNFTGFNPAIISKYTTSSYGKGLGRAYIACGNLHSEMLADEGLYALDAIRTPARLNAACNVKDFGRGSDGNTYQRSYYSGIRSISSDGKTFTLNSSIGAVGRLVMIHQLQKTAGADVNSGKFTLARITAKSSNVITVDTAFNIDLDNYYGQMAILYEHKDLKISGSISAGAAWASGVGGILPIVCNGTLDIRGAFLDVRGQGTKSSISNTLVGNNFMRSRLYIGQGHGTVFILARKILMDSSTRIGSNSDGALFGGTAYQGNSRSPEGGYAGKDGYYNDPNTSGSTKTGGTGGWGGGAGTSGKYPRQGGFFGNAPGWNNYVYDTRANQFCSLQGAHILIVADSIDGFNLHAISTGGELGDARCEQNDGWWRGTSGGCGYGGSGCGNFRSVNKAYNYAGAGGYRGGGAGTPNHSITRESERAHIFFGGGAAGAAFICANKITNQDTTGIVTS